MNYNVQDEFDVPLFNVEIDGLHASANTTFDGPVTFNGPVKGLTSPIEVRYNSFNALPFNRYYVNTKDASLTTNPIITMTLPANAEDGWAIQVVYDTLDHTVSLAIQTSSTNISYYDVYAQANLVSNTWTYDRSYTALLVYNAITMTWDSYVTYQDPTTLSQVGPQGAAGYTGSAGAQGPIGYTGSQGVIGYTGSRGTNGYNGSIGAQGPIGYTGSAGVNGYSGSIGAQGPTGYTGSIGAQGPIGYTGSQGATGYNGSIGATGYTGSIGYTGSSGAGIAVGGTIGQVLQKNSSTNYDTSWLALGTASLANTGNTGHTIPWLDGYNNWANTQLFNSTTQLAPKLALTGQEFYQANNAPTDGIAMLLGVNRASNRQLWIADTASLTQSNTNPAFRVALINGAVGIQALATDGVTALPLTINGSGGNVTLGGTVLHTAGMRNYGSSFSRFEGTGSVPPTGVTGVGVNLYQSGGTAYIESYNYTASAYSPLQLNGSAITLNAPTTHNGNATFSATLSAGAGTFSSLQVNNGFTTYGNISLGGPVTAQSLSVTYNAVIGNGFTAYGPIALSGATTVNSTLTATANVAINSGSSIAFDTNGVAAPALTTRSAGTKIILYPSISSSSADYAIGIDNNTMWSTVYSTSAVFKWFGGSTLAATLTGTGNLSLAGTLATTYVRAGANAQNASGPLAIIEGDSSTGYLTGYNPAANALSPLTIRASSINVSSNTVFNANVYSNAPVTLYSTLNVTANSALASVSASGVLGVNGATSLYNTLSVVGNYATSLGGSLSVASTASVASTLSVGGGGIQFTNSTYGGFTTSASYNAFGWFDGSNGNATMALLRTDRFSSGKDNTTNLGAASERWNTGYFGTGGIVSSGNVSAPNLIDNPTVHTIISSDSIYPGVIKGNTFTKTSTTSAWDAYAATNAIYGSCVLSARTPFAGMLFSVGLMVGNNRNVGSAQIEVRGDGAGNAYVYINGTKDVSAGTYDANSRMSITYTGLRYIVMFNGSIVKTISASPNQTLNAAIYLGTPNAYVSEVVISPGPRDSIFGTSVYDQNNTLITSTAGSPNLGNTARLGGTNPTLNLIGDSSSYYPTINFSAGGYNSGSGAVTGSIIGYGGMYYNTTTGSHQFILNGTPSLYVKSTGVEFNDANKQIVGTYDPTITRGLYAISSSYTFNSTPSNGTYGNFYGLAYSYEPGYGATGNNPQSKANLGHQLLLMNNGTTATAIGTGVWTSGSLTVGGSATFASSGRFGNDVNTNRGNTTGYITFGSGSNAYVGYDGSVIQTSNSTQINGNLNVTNGITIGYSSTISGSWTVNGDIYANRGTNSGVIFFGSNTSHYLFYDGSQYQLVNGTLNIGGGITASGASSFNAVTNFNAGSNFSSTSVFYGSTYIQSALSVWSSPTPGTTVGNLHIGNSSSTSNAGPALTFGARDAAGAQAGIYIQSDGNYGTRMLFATTNSYATGAQTAMSISESGSVSILHGTLNVNPTGSNYTEGIRVSTASDGYALLALGSDTSGGGSIAGQWTMLRNPSQNLAFRNGGGSDALTMTQAGALTLVGSAQSAAFTNAGQLGSNAVNARNHFTQYTAGTSSPLGTGWIAAAFGDASAPRVVIGQGKSLAIIGAHNGDLSAWAGVNYIATTHSWASSDVSSTLMSLSSAGALTVTGTAATGSLTVNGALSVTGNSVLQGSLTSSAIVSSGSLQVATTATFLSGISISGVASFGNTPIQVGAGVTTGYYGDGTNLAVRLQNNSSSTFFIQTYNGAANIAYFNATGVNFSQPIVATSASFSGAVAHNAQTNFNTTLQVAGNGTQLQFYTAGAGADTKMWRNYVVYNTSTTTSSSMYWDVVNDASSASASWMRVDRSGNSVTGINFNNPTYINSNLSVSGGVYTNNIYSTNGGVSTQLTLQTDKNFVFYHSGNAIWSSLGNNLTISQPLIVNTTTAFNVTPSVNSANMVFNGGAGGATVGASVSTGVFMDGNNVGFRTYSSNGIYFQNAGGGNTYAYVNSGNFVFNVPLNIPNGQWHNTADGVNRFYANANGASFYNAQNDRHVFRTSQSDRFYINTDGSATLVGNTLYFNNGSQYFNNNGSYYYMSTPLLVGGAVCTGRNPFFFGGMSDYNHCIGNSLESYNGSSDGETIFAWNHFSLRMRQSGNRLAIFAEGRANDSNNNGNNGYVGMYGITDPRTPLEVNGPITSLGCVGLNGNNDGGGQIRMISGKRNVMWRNDGSNFYLLFSDDVGNGDVRNASFNGFRPFRLDYNGNTSLNAEGNSDSYFGRNIYCNDIRISSDIRLKKNITTIDNALDIVDQLSGKRFDKRSPNNEDYEQSIGFIADEVELVLPELVHTGEDGYKRLEYANMVAVLVEAMKEMRAEINELKRSK